MAATTIHINTDTELKAKAQAILDDLGLDMSTAVNIFLTQMVDKETMPFETGKSAAANRECREMLQIEYEQFLDEMCGCINDPTFVEPPEIPYESPREPIL